MNELLNQGADRCPSRYSTTAYATSGTVKSSAGTLYGFYGYNSKTSSQFIQIHNLAVVPAEAAVPIITIIVPAQSNFAFSTGQFGMYFNTGITWVNSSTGPTKTIGSADVWMVAQYI